MSTTTIRVSVKARDMLHDLARADGISMQEIVEQAIESYRHQRLLAEANAAYAALRADPEAWAELEAEREAWDATLADGLEEV